MLPDGNGLELCSNLSELPARPGFILVTAKTARDDKIAGFAHGADDYITKPCALDELLARVHAVLRRIHPGLEQIDLDSIVVDFVKLTAMKSGHSLPVRPREVAVLRELVIRHGEIVTRDELLAAVWGCNEPSLTRTVNISIARLRRKIEPNPYQPRYLSTVHREGYFLTLP